MLLEMCVYRCPAGRLPALMSQVLVPADFSRMR